MSFWHTDLLNTLSFLQCYSVHKLNVRWSLSCLLLWVQSIVGELLVCVFLPLLPRNMKMVDIVTQKMPSENDVHVARSFLTKILRSSMRYGSVVSLSSTYSLFSTPCAIIMLVICHSNNIIIFPFIATLSLPWFIICTHWHVSLDCLVVHVIRWMIFIPFVQHAVHCLSMTCIHMFLCLYWLRNETAFDLGACHFMIICSVHLFLTCNSERIALKGMFHMHNWQLYKVFD